MASTRRAVVGSLIEAIGGNGEGDSAAMVGSGNGVRDSKLRTFAEIMAAVKPLQKPMTAAPVARSGASRSSDQEKTHRLP
ncbi:hypothetical protein Ancab_036146 [Ancistrocladus abbreviatus]